LPDDDERGRKAAFFFVVMRAVVGVVARFAHDVRLLPPAGEGWEGGDRSADVVVVSITTFGFSWRGGSAT